MPLFGEAAGKEIRKESLDGAKDKYMPNRREWDQQDNNEGDECDEVFNGSSAVQSRAWERVSLINCSVQRCWEAYHSKVASYIGTESNSPKIADLTRFESVTLGGTTN